MWSHLVLLDGEAAGFPEACGKQYIDRRVDVAMFRVQPYADARATALVDLVEEESISWQV